MVAKVIGIAVLLGTTSLLLASPSSQVTAETRYLAFQMFTGAPDPSLAVGGSGAGPLSPPSSKATMRAFVDRLVDRIGITGDVHTRLAFIIGPLAFDHTDAELRRMIDDAFEIAREFDIAVGFHIDDSMFWARRSDLWEAPDNVEWLDWEGTPNTGRRIDWSPQPTRFPPQMCINSPAIQVEVQHLASDVIGAAVQAGVRTLEGRGDLFAGVIVGWETQIGRDFESNSYLGYCALTHRGFSSNHPPQDLDSEREAIVQEFIEHWAEGIAEAGVDADRIYSHTAFLSQQSFDSQPPEEITYSQANHFAPPPVSFGANHRPGFSTYPQPGLLEQLYEELENHGNPGWASSEGTNLMPSSLTSGASMETYLASLFNHGATLVNIFGWDVGPPDNPFRMAAEGSESISAYGKFLRGEVLVEGEYSFPLADLPTKIQTIQTELPGWIQQHPERQSEVEPLLQQLDLSLREGRYQDAETIVDAILALMEP